MFLLCRYAYTVGIHTRLQNTQTYLEGTGHPQVHSAVFAMVLLTSRLLSFPMALLQEYFLLSHKLAGQWWLLPLIPALGRQRWVSKFETSLVYRVSSRTAKAIQRNPVLNLPPPPSPQIKESQACYLSVSLRKSNWLS